jgi:colanic acid/amylovoran biosynthesis glycosyltransferase
MSELHVGYILKQYPRLSETFVLNEILGLERAGVDVSIFSLNFATEGRFHPDIASVNAPVHYMPLVDKSAFLDAIRALPDLDAEGDGTERLNSVLDFVDRLPAERRAKLLLHAIEVADQVRRTGVNHLHAHFLTVAAHTAHIVHLLTGVAYTVTAHAKDIYRHTVDWNLAAHVANSAAAIVTVCDANLRHLQLQLDGITTPIVRIYNGLSPQEPPAPLDARSRNLVVGVGRLVEKKGFDLLLDAVHLLAPSIPDISCVLIGDGEERPALEAQSIRLGIDDRVTFTGSMPQHQVSTWLRRAHVMAAPCKIGGDGNQDALPTVLLEALGAGLPTVSTPVAGIPEIIEHGREGLIVETDDASAVANALTVLMGDDELWTSMALRGPNKLSARFDRMTTIGELIATFTAPSAASGAITSSIASPSITPERITS